MPSEPRDTLTLPPPASPAGVPPPRPATVTLRANPESDPEAACDLHVGALTASVHARGLLAVVGQRVQGVDLTQTAAAYVEDVTRRMAPRDPAEQMLVAQLVLAHTRVLHLTDLATQKTSLDSLRILNEYADRASNTYRRLMLALAEYRRPPRGGDSFTAIRQANIAEKQVVVNGGSIDDENATNEQGCHADECGQRPQAVPAE